MLWETSLRSGEVFTVECRFKRIDGEYKWFLAKALPLTKEGSAVNLSRGNNNILYFGVINLPLQR